MTDDDNSERAPRVLLTVLLGVGVLIVFAVLGVALADLNPDSDEEPAAPRSAPDRSLAAVTEHQVVADHVIDPVDYKQTPPVGGPHNPLWLNCGVYGQAIPSENAVHSMEHGAVWITYDPSVSDGDVTRLEQSAPSTYAILSPFDGLPGPVVVSAWGRQLVLESADDPRLQAFMREYRMGGVAPEIGAPCEGASDGTLPLDAAERTG